MILRSLTAHVKAQNWFAVAIDFIIVVIGVFIGIQVANWNAAEGDRRIAGKYLADVADDVRSDIVEISRTRDSAMVRIGAAAYVLREAGVGAIATTYEIAQSNADDALAGFEQVAIPEAAPPPPASRDRLWALATGIYFYDTNRSAYDALISSGKIELIGDARVMRAMREFYYLINALYETQRRTIQPARQFILETGLAHGLSPEGVAAESALIGAVKADAALAASVAASREYATLHILLCDAADRKAQELIKLLEAAR